MKRKDILAAVAVSAFGLLIGYTACAPFVDSPFSDQVLTRSRDLNDLALARLSPAQVDIESDGVIRIAMIADVHQNYADLDQVIYEINQTSGLDFIANLGDFTNSGYNLEYDQFIDSYNSFRLPTLTVMGNHDGIGSGSELFQKVFGPGNFYFESNSHRFIFFNTANLEDHEDFDPNWLKQVVDSSTKPVIIFTHCSLQDPERFTGSVAVLFDSILQDSKVQMVLNGHNHVYYLTSAYGTTLLQIPRVQGNAWVLLEINGNQLTITQKLTGEQEVVTLKH